MLVFSCLISDKRDLIFEYQHWIHRISRILTHWRIDRRSNRPIVFILKLKISNALSDQILHFENKLVPNQMAFGILKLHKKAHSRAVKRILNVCKCLYSAIAACHSMRSNRCGVPLKFQDVRIQIYVPFQFFQFRHFSDKIIYKF